MMMTKILLKSVESLLAFVLSSRGLTNRCRDGKSDSIVFGIELKKKVEVIRKH